MILAAAFPVLALQAQQPAAPPTGVPAQSVQASDAQAPGSDSTAPTDQNAPTIRLGVNEVNLIFTVTDKHGHYIPNLKLSDFALLDNQRAPARVNSFHQQINLPLRVGIVIDASTSIRTRFQFEQQSASEFLLETLKSNKDRAFVMGFDVTPTVEQDWTDNLDALEAGINRLRPGGGTALFDAVYTACRDKLLSARGTEPVRKAMILISDGDDNQSRVHPDEAIKNVPARRNHHLRHQHQLDPQSRQGRQGFLATWPKPPVARSSSRHPSKTCPTASKTLKKNCAANMRLTTRLPTSRMTAHSAPSTSIAPIGDTRCALKRDTSLRVRSTVCAR